MAASLTKAQGRTRPWAMDEMAYTSRTKTARRRHPGVHRSYIIPVLIKAIAAMRLLEASEGPLSIHKISHATGTTKSTTYRILRTLLAQGLLPDGSRAVYSFRLIPQVMADQSRSLDIHT